MIESVAPVSLSIAVTSSSVETTRCRAGRIIQDHVQMKPFSYLTEDFARLV
jgi:hypothetical protein